MTCLAILEGVRQLRSKGRHGLADHIESRLDDPEACITLIRIAFHRWADLVASKTHQQVAEERLEGIFILPEGFTIDKLMPGVRTVGCDDPRPEEKEPPCTTR